MIRFIAIMSLLASILTISSCNKEELSVTADFNYSLKEGNTYTFNVLTPQYDSAVWTIENKKQRGATIEHSFLNEGTFDVLLKVYLSNDKGEQVSHETSKSVSIASQFETIKISTKFGDFGFYLYQSTPKHKENFLKLTKENYFDGTTFHRIIKNFVIQGGDPLSKDSDPNNDGTGGPGYTIERELNGKLTHVQGAIGAARKSTETASNGSQFYVVENISGAHHLDGQYTVFGIVFYGLDVVTSIASQSKDGNDRPTTNIEMDAETVWYSAAELKSQFGFEIPAE